MTPTRMFDHEDLPLFSNTAPRAQEPAPFRPTQAARQERLPEPNPACPDCHTPMRQTRRGATLAKRGPAWVCPQAEAERVTDERGHLHMTSDIHETVWVYFEGDPRLEAAS